MTTPRSWGRIKTRPALMVVRTAARTAVTRMLVDKALTFWPREARITARTIRPNDNQP
jgi:hypothetical protein